MAGINLSSAEITTLKNKICWRLIFAANGNIKPEGKTISATYFSYPPHEDSECLCQLAINAACHSIDSHKQWIPKRKFTWHALIHKWIRLKSSSPPDTRALSPGCCVHFSDVSTSSVWMSLSRLSSLHWTYA